MRRRRKTIVSRNDIVNWAKSQSAFLDGLQLTLSQISSVRFAQTLKNDKFEVYLVASRKLGRDAMAAPRVCLGVMRATPAKMILVDNRTELVIREKEDTDESWRVKLRLACSRLAVDPKFIDELAKNVKKVKA